MAEEALSSKKKAKLIATYLSLKFENDDELDPYRCNMCNDVAIYHYVASCKHLFCGKCHGIYANKACPIKNCSNLSIDKVFQTKDVELGVKNLKAHCVYNNNGCEEILSLSELLDHKSKCRFSPKHILPKLWTPSVGKTIDELVKDFTELKKVVGELQQQNLKCDSEKLENDIRMEIANQSCIVERKLQETEKNLSEECKKCSTHFDEKLSKLRNELLVEVSLNLAQKLERQIQTSENKLVEKMNEQNVHAELNIKSSFDLESQKIKRDYEKLTENWKQNLEKKITIVQTESSRALLDVQRNIVDNTKIKNDVQKMERQMLNLEPKLQEFRNSNETLQKNLEKYLTTVQTENSQVTQNLQRISNKMDNINIRNADDLSFLKRNVETLDRNVAILSRQMIEDNSPEFTWSIKSIDKKVIDLITGHSTHFESGVLTAMGYKVQMEAQLYYSSQNNYFGLKFNLKGIDMDDSNSSKFYGFYQTRISIRNKSKDLSQNHIWRVVDFGHNKEINAIFGYGRVILFTFLKKGSPYIEDNSIEIKFRLVPYFVLHKFFQSDNGILFWKLDNFKQGKQDGIDGISDDIQSEEFYTMKQGYRMQILVFFEEKQLKIYQFCIKGEYDKLLSKTHFPHRIKIIVFDQSDAVEKKNLSKTVETNDTYSEVCHFSYTEFENPRYLKNDCLFIKAIVEHTT